MSVIPLGTRVKIVDEVEKEYSILVGQCGKVIGYKWNKFRQARNLPVVQLDNGQVISGWSLWFETLVHAQTTGDTK